MNKFCTNCGAELNSLDKFCSSCGAKQADISTSINDKVLDMQQTSKRNDILNKELGKIGFASGMIGNFASQGLFSSLESGIIGALGSAWVSSKLPIDEVHESFIIDKDVSTSMEIVFNALSSMGSIVDISQYTKYPALSGCCKSGFGNMNPAIICVEFIQTEDLKTKLHISGYAKEGLIKQKTAIKAIDRFKKLC